MTTEEEYEEMKRETAAMKEDLESGMTQGEVLSKYGISKSTLQRRFQGRVPSATGVTKKELAKIQRDEQTVNMYADSLRGMSTREIGKKYGVSQTMVQRRINSIEVDLTPAAIQVYRQQEFAKLSLLEQKLWKRIDDDYYTVSHGKIIINPETDEPLVDVGPVLAIADRLLKIQDRRASLGGFDAPARIEVDHSVTDIQVTEVKDLVERAREEMRLQEESLRAKAIESNIEDAEVVDTDDEDV